MTALVLHLVLAVVLFVARLWFCVWAGKVHGIVFTCVCASCVLACLLRLVPSVRSHRTACDHLPVCVCSP